MVFSNATDVCKSNIDCIAVADIGQKNKLALFNAITPFSMHEMMYASRLVPVAVISFYASQDYEPIVIVKMMDHCTKLTASRKCAELERIVCQFVSVMCLFVDDDLRID